MHEKAILPRGVFSWLLVSVNLSHQQQRIMKHVLSKPHKLFATK